VRLRAARVGDLAQLRILAKPPVDTLGNRTAQLYRGPCGSARATRQTPLPEYAVTSKVMASGLDLPVTRCARFRAHPPPAGGLTWHGGVAGGHWRSRRLLVGSGNGDRVSTSRYPLVSALSPVVGTPLTTSACARFTPRRGPNSPAPRPNPQVSAKKASIESLFAAAQVGALGTARPPRRMRGEPTGNAGRIQPS
jgi:hypothetical protein